MKPLLRVDFSSIDVLEQRTVAVYWFLHLQSKQGMARAWEELAFCLSALWVPSGSPCQFLLKSCSALAWMSNTLRNFSNTDRSQQGKLSQANSACPRESRQVMVWPSLTGLTGVLQRNPMAASRLPNAISGRCLS